MLNISQQIKFFDRKFVSSALRDQLRCPKCCNEFTHHYQLFFGDSHVRSNRPFLLPCGHNMCENCIYQNRQNLSCSVCLRPTKALQKGPHFHVRDCFDINFFLFGEVQSIHYNRRNASNNNSLHMSVTEHIVQKCAECEEVPGLGICKQCNFYYCNPCFEKVHKHSKVMKRHILRSEQGVIIKVSKSHTCNRHRRHCDRYCKKCRLICCLQCLQVDHKSHSWSTVLEENEVAKDDVNCLLDTIKDSRDKLMKAQKDVKAAEIQLEQYASETMSNISNFFLQMHSFLQVEERRIVDHFLEESLPMQLGFRDAYARLNQTQSALNNIRSNLESFTRNPPRDILLHDFILDTNTQLEEFQCQVQTSRLTRNPFIFRSEKDICKDLRKLFNYEYQDPELTIWIGPIYGDLNRSFRKSPSTNFGSHNHINKSIRGTKASESSTHSVASSLTSEMCPPESGQIVRARSPSDAALGKSKNNCLARISHLKSPSHFYIQMEDMVPQIRELSNKFGLFSDQEPVRASVSEGCYYMAYCTEDKQWYRAQVQKKLAKDLFRLFLVDFGMSLELPAQRLCEISERSLSVPFAAVRCALNDLLPVGKKWTEEAKQLLLEITNNKSVRVNIVEQVDSHNWKVDLFTTHTSHPVSVCDSFLYTGLAREKPGVLNFKLKPKKISPVARVNQRLPKHSFNPGETVMIQVIHVEDPQEFFVIKIEDIADRKRLRDELSQIPLQNPTLEKIFWAPLGMCCALRGENSWHRACVLKVLEGGLIRVRLVDEGSQKTVVWHQLFVLPGKFQLQKEFAIKCSLADIAPLQKNNYMWSEESIQQFKQFSANPKLHLFIYSAKQDAYQVALYVSKKHLNINIGSMLVKYGHGLSTGEASQNLEIFKSNNSTVNMTKPAVAAEENTARSDQTNSTSTEKPDENVVSRTVVFIRHIRNPGEFYVSLKSLETGYRKFHQQIQESLRCSQDLSDMQLNLAVDWSVGDHCLVYTNYKLAEKVVDSEVPEHYEWYRGVIVAVNLVPEPEYPFSVFLRDVGATVLSIRRSQLYMIDPQLDRVSNAVYRCHLACVQPTGGVATWSHTSIDFFKRSIEVFQALGITLQGKSDPETKSCSVVLWGITPETTDPLAPCITKYVNINRSLVNAGLAHLVERLNLQQMNRMIEQERADDEITIEEWFNNLSQNMGKIDLHRSQDVIEIEESVFSRHQSLDSALNLDDHDTLDEQDETVSEVAAKTWVKSKNIVKSIFTAYPTNVDVDAIIYLHDADDDSLLKKISAEIEQKYSQRTLPKESAVSYKVGQPCIARYHMDNMFYRVLIKKVLPNDNFDVFFIDYGNVEPCYILDMRPFVPFPKLPALASKYSIEGICPKNGMAAYPTNALDFIHSTIVGKLVSLRVATSELSKEVKKCSIRAGPEDLAQRLIAQGYADAKPWMPTMHKDRQKICRKSSKASLNDFNNNCASIMSIDNDVPNNTGSINAVDEPNRICNVMFDDIEKKFELALRGRSDVDMYEYDIKHPQNRSNEEVDDNQEDDDDIDERFNEFLDRLNTDDVGIDADLFSDLKDTNTTDAMMQHTVLPPPPPAKKRMFDIEDYKKMQEQINFDDLCKSIQGTENFKSLRFGKSPSDKIDAEDDDVVELELSFASNYWHTEGTTDSTTKQKRRSGYDHHKNPQCISSTDDIANATATDESWYDQFQPNDTSSVFSYFKSTDIFKAPKLPSGIQNFFCTVIAVVAPTLLYVFPHLAELEYHATEMTRAIKRLARNAAPLKQFEPKSACLAFSPKKQKWYRAAIRSYISTSKEVVLIYVDYLTVETVPIKNLRQYPKELASWPLYTLPVSLAGLKPNPRMRENDIRQALTNVVAKRTLYAQVKPSTESSASRKADDERSERLMEVELYESKTLANSSVIYEDLITDKFYICNEKCNVLK